MVGEMSPKSSDRADRMPDEQNNVGRIDDCCQWCKVRNKFEVCSLTMCATSRVSADAASYYNNKYQMSHRGEKGLFFPVDIRSEINPGGIQ